MDTWCEYWMIIGIMVSVECWGELHTLACH